MIFLRLYISEYLNATGLTFSSKSKEHKADKDTNPHVHVRVHEAPMARCPRPEVGWRLAEDPLVTGP